MPEPTIEIHNDDLHWDGTALGLQPRIVNPTTAKLVQAPSPSDGELVALLRDPDRFAITHVLLTMRRNALTSFDANQWNGLHVTLPADSPARYDARDMEVLHRRWAAAVGTGADR